MTTYWRIQKAADPISKDWRSQIGLDEDGLGTEEGTSACRSFAELQTWARCGHANWIAEMAVIEFVGEEVGTGTDGEVIVWPSRELQRVRFSGGSDYHALVSVVIQGMSVPSVAPIEDENE